MNLAPVRVEDAQEIAIAITAEAYEAIRATLSDGAPRANDAKWPSSVAVVKDSRAAPRDGRVHARAHLVI
jgi:hypothetical protein